MRLALCILLLFLCPTGQSVAQQVPPAGPADNAPAEPLTEPGDVQSTDQQVTLDHQVDDGRIAERLRDIYQASGWFDSLSVQASDGIVFIDGRTTSEEYRDWAGQLARRTEGVVAVVNRIDVDAPPALNSFSLKRELAELWAGFLRLLPLIGIGLLAILLCAIIARYLSRLLVIPISRLTDSQLLQNISRKLIAVVIVLIGVIFFLRLTGLTGVAVTLVSGTGILGLILGFAFRDIAENFLASVLMSVQTPFRLGDVVEVAGHTGVVHKVTARGTVLVDFDGNHIQIANATVYKSTIKNLTANPKMRLSFIIGIGYDASVVKAQDVAMGVLRDHPAVLDDPEPLVLVDQLGTSTINLRVYFWIDTHEHSWLKVKSAAIRLVLRAIEKAGISLPDEAREIIFPDGVPLVMHHEPGPAAGGPDRPDSSKPHPAAPARQTDPQTVASDLADHATQAEGDLSSDVDEIKHQAAESREVEAGSDILTENGSARVS